VPRDYSEAAIWFRKAAEKGHQGSQVALGRLYAQGLGVEKDNDQALFWLRKAAAQGGAPGLVAQQLITSLQGAPAPTPPGAPFATMAQTLASGMESIRAKAEQGDVTSQRALGDFYSLRGFAGSADDAAQAMTWWRKAADQGDVQAMNKLAGAYAVGKLVPRDAEQAMSWARKAADKDDAGAEMQLGAGYALGFGVPKDKDQALTWYRKAAAHGGWIGGQANSAIADLDQQGRPPPPRRPTSTACGAGPRWATPAHRRGSD